MTIATLWPTLAYMVRLEGAWNWWVLAPAGVGGLAVAFVIAWVAARRGRKSKLAALAGELGLSAVALDDLDQVKQALGELLGESVLFKSDYVTTIDVWLRGQVDGAELHVLDVGGYPVHGRPRRADEEDAYYGRAGFGDKVETFIVLRDATLQLPRFLLVPNNAFVKTLGTRKDVIQWPDGPFSDRNRVIASDEAGVRQLFDRPLQVLLTDNRDLSLESCGDVLLLCRYGRRLSPNAVRDLINQARQIYGIVKQR